LERFTITVNKKISFGSLTDGRFKLEVHIMNFEESEYNLMKGDKVKVIGIMHNSGIGIYFYYYIQFILNCL